jgi:cytochrome P450
VSEVSEMPIPPLPTWRPAVSREEASTPCPSAGAARVALPRGQAVWLISGYDLCRRVLSHPDLRSDHADPNYPDLFPIKKSRRDGGAGPSTYSGMDHPEHTLHRRLIANEFSRRAVELWRGRVAAIAEQALGEMCETGARSGDLVNQYAEPIASVVIFEFLGVPARWRPELARLAGILLGDAGADREAAQGASTVFRACLNEVIAEKEAHSGDDLLGRLADRYREEKRYSRAQFVEFAGALVTAGRQTVASMIALSAAMLIERPEERHRMLADRRLLALGVEELLRFLSVANLAPARVAVADVELGDIHICRGEGVVSSTAHANYDALHFMDPTRFDIHRKAPPHLAFGYGAHKCLGQHLARLELEAALSVLFKALPDIRLCDAGPVKLRHEVPMLAVEEMRVGW